MRVVKNRDMGRVLVRGRGFGATAPSSALQHILNILADVEEESCGPAIRDRARSESQESQESFRPISCLCSLRVVSLGPPWDQVRRAHQSGRGWLY